MSANTISGNRNSTPEASNTNLRPPASRNTVGTSHALRSSADLGFSSSPLSGRNIRPSSEVIYNQAQQNRNQGNPDDAMDKAAQQWIADIDQYETTLEEMAAATLDQDFKDELSAIEQWFKVLSEAERTAALYALLQQTTQVQIRFFIQVLQQMAKSHPMSGVLSPTSFGEKDATSSRLSDAMSKLHVEGSRNSIGRPPPSPGPSAKRNSGMDPSVINAMFPDAAAAIAKQKAEYTQQTGIPPNSNRNSVIGGDRNSLVAPSISAPVDTSKEVNAPSSGPWVQRQAEMRPMSSSGQQPMGQFSQPPPSAGLRSPRPFQLSGSSNTQSTTLLAPDSNLEMPILSPYALGNTSWASMTNTPMVPNFNAQQQQPHPQADFVANATAMKLAALSTVNNRIALDDVKKYRRTKSNDNSIGQMPMSPGIPGTNVLVVNESGQLLNSQPINAQQLAAIQAQQQAAMAMRGGRPDSPGLAMQGATMAGVPFTSPQNKGYLAAHDGSFGTGGNLSLGQYGIGHGSHEGYLSDHSEIARGRSPRGRRGSSKPPEDPTDPTLLQDIPNWLRSLRLHKYTDNLKDLKWTDLIMLDDKGLEDRGVNALGARRKMLKVFETVREAQAEGKA